MSRSPRPDPSSSAAAAPALTPREVTVILIGVLTGLLLATIDQTIVATALPAITADLGDARLLPWVMSANLVAAAAATPLVGKLSDIHGRAVVVRGCILLFLAASVAAALSGSMGQLVAARALQGVGSGGIAAMTFTVIGDVVSPRERGRYQGYIVAVFASGALIGPLLGGLIVETLSWRWIFWLNLPIGALALAVGHLALRKLAGRRAERRVDYLGAALLLPAVVCLLIATSLVAQGVDWYARRVALLALAGTGFALLFVLHALRSPEPLLPLRMFRLSPYRSAVMIMIAAAALMVGGVVLLPIYYQLVFGLGPGTAGAWLVAFSLPASLGALISGRTMTATGRYRILPIIGFCCVVTGYAGMALLGPGSGVAVFAAASALAGMGIGFSFPVTMVSVQNVASARDLGIATTSVSFFRLFGGSLGVALLTAVLIERLGSGLAAAGGLDGRTQEARRLGLELLEGGRAGLLALPPDVQAATAATAAAAFQGVFLLGAGIALLGLVGALTLKEVPLRTSVGGSG